MTQVHAETGANGKRFLPRPLWLRACAQRAGQSALGKQEYRSSDIRSLFFAELKQQMESIHTFCNVTIMPIDFESTLNSSRSCEKHVCHCPQRPIPPNEIHCLKRIKLLQARNSTQDEPLQDLFWTLGSPHGLVKECLISNGASIQRYATRDGQTANVTCFFASCLS